MNITKLQKKLGKRITALRQKKGMTSEKLAYETGISKGYLSDIEHGKKIPSIRTLAQLAETLSLDVKDFF